MEGEERYSVVVGDDRIVVSELEEVIGKLVVEYE